MPTFQTVLWSVHYCCISLQDDGKAERPDKARLMSRIAKMGQAMFPVAAGAQQTTEADDNTVGDNEVVSPNYIVVLLLQ